MSTRNHLSWAVAGCASVLLATTARAELPTQDWTRTETHADCASYNPLRSPFFGETHIHTSYSGDAAFVRVRTTPRDAYMFAQGQQIGLPPYDAMDLPTRFAQLRRPLDFTAVTDHAEFLGEIRTCLNVGLPGYDDPTCQDVRTEFANPPAGINAPIPAVVIAFQLTIQAANPMRLGLCGPGGTDCLTQAALVWQDSQDAAEEFYDRTAACSFTTFPGYEWTNNLDGFNLHRNIIFRNAEVQALPTSYYEEPLVEGLFGALENDCLGQPGNCDFVSIPHNSNASGGLMFETANGDGSPLTKADAIRRSTHETLLEVFQHKGSSECNPASSNDELCGFEQLKRLQLFGNASNSTVPTAPNYARRALGLGLQQHDLLGANPFKLGFIGSTDGHSSLAGGTVEEDFGTTGHLGIRDGSAENILSRIGPGGIVTNGGGLAVLWAEENSRDALFAAMRRREAYATSGTRPVVRFFAGRPDKELCGSPDFVEEGYTHGVPMGGEIGPVLSRKSPRFAVLAMQDPGGNGEPSTPLQRIQIVKGWVDDENKIHERVFEVAGEEDNGAGVDPATCATTGSGGSASLCAVWEDKTFRPNERAFYYARVLENPICRWSTRLCNSLGVDCSNIGSVPLEYRECCMNLAEKTIQERAWTSPVYYQPEGFGTKGHILFGNDPGTDRLKLELTIGRVPSELDVNANGLTVTVSDDDVVYTVTLPAGAMVEKAPGRVYAYADPAGSIAGLKKAKLRINKRGTGILTVEASENDLSAAEVTNHRVDVQVASGAYDQTDSRYWAPVNGRLKALR